MVMEMIWRIVNAPRDVLSAKRANDLRSHLEDMVQRHHTWF